MRKLAFVIPWYGLDIPGGSEAACRNIAERMAARGMEVEVLTTCVRQFASDWSENYYPEGMEELNHVKVRRFKATKRNASLFDKINYKLINNQAITIEEEKVFLKEMVNSKDLESYIRVHKDDYEAFLFIPYMFGTTFHGIQHALDKAILLPAFHDESYAYFKSFKDVYSKVRGMIFFSQAEKEWATAHYDLGNVEQKVLGLGINPFEASGDRFRRKYGIYNPFIMYAGRKDHGKNVHILIEYFNRYIQTRNSKLRLVLIGGGTIDVPSNCRDYVHDLGFVDEQDKYDAYAAAKLFCNPSPNESFSIVIMESWYAGRPILVNEYCQVTKRFCEVSNGGLYYSDYEEFAACVDLLAENKHLAKSMGSNGKQYVENNFQWDKVIDNYIQFIHECSEVNVK